METLARSSCSRRGRRPARRPLPSGPIRICDALPVVPVVALVADDRDAAQSRRVRVVEPVLKIERAGTGTRAVGSGCLGVLPLSGPAVDHVDEGGHRQPTSGSVHQAIRRGVAAFGAATAPEVDRHRPRARLEDDRRHVPPHQLPHLCPVGGDQRRLIPAPVRERRRAEDPRRQRPRQAPCRHPHPRRDEHDEQQGDDPQRPDPLHRPLSPLPVHHPTRQGQPTLCPSGRRPARPAAPAPPKESSEARAGTGPRPRYSSSIAAAMSAAAFFASSNSIEVFGS